MDVSLDTINTDHGPMVVISSDDRISQTLKKKQTWEQIDIDACVRYYNRRKQKHHNTIIDVGCNLGTYSIPLAKLYTDHSVIAIDCQRIMCDCLDQTLQLQDITNCTVCHSAISACNNTEFSYKKINYRWGANFGAFELLPPNQNSDFNGVQLDIDEHVPMSTIDSFDLANVGFIKMDIEGMEHLALQGACETIKESTPLLAFESHKCNMDDLHSTLKFLNYRVIGKSQTLTFAHV